MSTIILEKALGLSAKKNKESKEKKERGGRRGVIYTVFCKIDLP